MAGFAIKGEADLHEGDSGRRPVRLGTPRETLKVLTKFLLRDEDAVLFMKAAKIALDFKLGKTYDSIIPLFRSILGTETPVILDVGANMGQFAARVSQQFPNGQLYCFEPLHGNVAGLNRLKRWLRLKNVTVREEAICDRIGIERIHVPVSGGMYRDAALAVLEGSKKTFDNVKWHVESVRTNTIDAFVSEQGITRLDLIKVDTEGAEDRVVQGGMMTISRFLPALYLETSPYQAWLTSLYEKGYLPFYYDGKSLHAPREGERQTNVLLVHRSKSNAAQASSGPKTDSLQPGF